MKSRLYTLGWLVLLSGVIGVFFHETLFDGFSLVPTDVLHQFISPYDNTVRQIHVQNHYTFDVLRVDYPWAKFGQESLQAGEVPLWNPYIFGGHPHLAVSMHGVLNPFKVLYLFLSTERAFSLGVVMELWLAGLLMFAFLRELDRSRPAAFLGGVAYALNSGFLMWYWRVPGTFAWAPLILLLVERSMRRKSWSHAAGAGAILGLAMISGSIQTAAHLGFLCVGYLAGTVLCVNHEGRPRAFQRASLVLAVGMLAYAVQLLPTLELMLREGTHRLQTVGPKAVSLRHTLLGIPALVTFAFPGLAGSTESYSVLRVFGGDMIEFTGYIGIVPFTLFMVGAWVVRDRPVRWLLVTAGGVLAIIFFTPLVRFVYHRFFIVVTFAMSVIAAYGMDAVLDASAANSRVVRRVLVGMLGLGLAVMIGVIVAQTIVTVNWNRLVEAGQKYILAYQGTVPFGSADWQLARVPLFLQHYRITNMVFWLPLAMLAGAVLAWQAYVRGWLSRNVFSAVLLLFTVTDLTALGRKLVPQVDLREFPLYPPLQTIQTVQADHDLFRVQQWAPDQPMFLVDTILPVYGLSTISSADSLAPENLAMLPYWQNGEFTAVADLLNIKYVFVPDTSTLPKDHFSLVQQAQGIRLYRNNRCLPRVQFIPHWRVVKNRGTILAEMDATTFDPRQTVFLERDPPSSFTSQPAPPGVPSAATTRVERYAPRHVQVVVHCAQPGVVLLGDTYYPGWRATVDGARVPIYRADYVMRAVLVTAGDHQIEFDYEPLSFRLGAAISGVTLAGCLLAGLWLKTRRRAGATKPAL